MPHVPTLSTLRTLLVASAAFALSACGGGSGQQVTPPSGGGLSPQSVPQHSVADNARSSEDADGGEGDGGGSGGGIVAYNSIPKPLKAVVSLGFEATTATQAGDGVNLAHTGKLLRVRYVLSSWGCQTGHWTSGCVTTGHPTFPVPITVNVYAVDNTKVSKVGNLLATQTRTFNIPFRPSSDVARCPSGQQFFSAVDNACVHGLANVIAFNFAAPRVSLPAQTIVSLAYNTSDYGSPPVGHSPPCYTSSAGCGYDSLNVSTDGNGGPIGSPVDPNGIFVRFTDPGQYCVPAGSDFRLDTPCWTGYHPQFEVIVTGGRGSRDED